MVTSIGALNEKSKEFLGSSMASLSAMNEGLQTIAGEAADYSKKSLEDGSALIQRLASTRSVEQAFQAQSAFSKNAYEAFVTQAAKFGELYADLAKEAFKPYESVLVKVRK
ncbi:phasin family protein [Phyllobacterium sp. YR531]|uniref:phasin family protein n=1 Tax=Phyllobacterium sp. YR531 TaxID=1144343 RepID=UPI00026FAA67|nr:phasin family protein [Phyllobacterium sp. YR531]EJM98095.1 Phasin protein [Phyllobacterium sp. YR531]